MYWYAWWAPESMATAMWTLFKLLHLRISDIQKNKYFLNKFNFTRWSFCLHIHSSYLASVTISTLHNQYSTQSVQCTISTVYYQFSVQSVQCTVSTVHSQYSTQSVQYTNSTVHNQNSAQSVQCTISTVYRMMCIFT